MKLTNHDYAHWRDQNIRSYGWFSHIWLEKPIIVACSSSLEIQLSFLVNSLHVKPQCLGPALSSLRVSSISICSLDKSASSRCKVAASPQQLIAVSHKPSESFIIFKCQDCFILVFSCRAYLADNNQHDKIFRKNLLLQKYSLRVFNDQCPGAKHSECFQTFLSLFCLLHHVRVVFAVVTIWS